MNECGPANNFFYKDGKKIERQKCTVFTRICGYLRPNTMANIGKKQEFKDRKLFKAEFINNSKFLLLRQNAKFIEKYS